MKNKQLIGSVLIGFGLAVVYSVIITSMIQNPSNDKVETKCYDAYYNEIKNAVCIEDAPIDTLSAIMVIIGTLIWLIGVVLFVIGEVFNTYE